MITLLPHQTFQHQDLFILLLLFVIELVLSSDNILAISLILQDIEEKKRKICLIAGVWGSIVFRAAIVFSASLLFLINPLKVLAGMYLFYLCVSHLYHKKKAAPKEKPSIPIWKGILLIEFTDILFALDSIFIALGVLSFFYNKQEVQTKIWIAFLAGASGVIFLRFLATYLLKLLQKYPIAEKIAYLLVGWIGIKLIFIGLSLPHDIPYFNTIFIVGIGLIILFSFFSTKSAQR